jgi:hypothetical protein
LLHPWKKQQTTPSLHHHPRHEWNKFKCSSFFLSRCRSLQLISVTKKEKLGGNF